VGKLIRGSADRYNRSIFSSRYPLKIAENYRGIRTTRTSLPVSALLRGPIVTPLTESGLASRPFSFSAFSRSQGSIVRRALAKRAAAAAAASFAVASRAISPGINRTASCFPRWDAEAARVASTKRVRNDEKDKGLRRLLEEFLEMVKFERNDLIRAAAVRLCPRVIRYDARETGRRRGGGGGVAETERGNNLRHELLIAGN